jgi:hypothetical protein
LGWPGRPLSIPRRPVKDSQGGFDYGSGVVVADRASIVVRRSLIEGKNVFEGNNRGRKPTASGDGQLCRPEGPVEVIHRRNTDV